MLRVYLDQNHWVMLLKAESGHAGGERCQDVALVLREAVDRGWVSLPLSMAHSMELQHRANYESRLELANVMLSYSKSHAIAPQRVLLRGELDGALRSRFGRPTVPRKIQSFGVGINHLHGRRLVNYKLPDDLPPISDEQRQQLIDFGTHMLETAAFAGVPSDLEIADWDPNAYRKVGVEFSEEQERMRNVRRLYGYHRRERGVAAACVDTYNEFNERITEALEFAGLHWGHMYSLEKDGMTAFIEDVPTMFAHRELRRLRHAASEKPWEENDLTDLEALAPAMVYCDVVVTERLWTDLAHRAKLDERFGTKICRDLKDLTPALLGAAVA